MTPEMLITEIRDWIANKFLANPKAEAVDVAKAAADHFMANEIDWLTGEPYVPYWILDTAEAMLDEGIFEIGQLVVLIKDYLSELRYQEDDVVLPKGSAGVVEQAEADFGIITYFVNFGTVTLAVYPDQMAALKSGLPMFYRP